LLPPRRLLCGGGASATSRRRRWGRSAATSDGLELEEEDRRGGRVQVRQAAAEAGEVRGPYACFVPVLRGDPEEG